MSVVANICLTIMGSLTPIREVRVHPDTWRGILAESSFGVTGDTIAGVRVAFDPECPLGQVYYIYGE